MAQRSNQITIAVTPELEAVLRQEGVAKGLSLSAYVRLVLESRSGEGLQNQESEDGLRFSKRRQALGKGYDT